MVVNKMNFPDFTPFLEKLTNGRCRYVYYCPHEARLSEGLHAIQNDCDFNEFLEDINEKKRLDVYVDHYHEPLFDWIQEEELHNKSITSTSPKTSRSISSTPKHNLNND
ncbi:unnamed protein product [Lactuca saligna]|uniref:Uncharacterized protein n=1 Tax=Lactuca saligna TaxID=75948 RepID=A0AA35Z2U9_LACSI|nr:unnamed protein product [Lactuca saligna]